MSLDSKFYGEDIKNVKQIEFNIFTNKEIKKYSAVKNDPFGINIADSYDNYEPKKGGLVDLRLGTCDIYLPCTTCGLNANECTGHFGHIELADNVFHYGFLNHLKSILQCVCLSCSKLLLEYTDENIDFINNLNNKQRFKVIKELTKNINFCWNCGTGVPKIKKEVKEQSGSIKILLEREVGNVIIDEKTGESNEMKKKIKQYLTPRECYNVLRNVSNTDSFMLGFGKDSRPEDLIIIRFPVPPVSIRPTGKIDFLAASTMEDSLTLKIADIVKANNRVRNRIDKQITGTDLTAYGQDFHTLLQYHIATYYDNESASLPKSEFKTGNKPTKSIKDRIEKKTGRVRNNLMGKRVDFSARSVITSDPYISIDEVGVPLKIAMNLTIPEEVTPNNIKHLTSLVKKGSKKYPGANYVKRKSFIDGKEIDRTIDLKYRKKDIKLSYGDVVLRHIVNGDYVLFNRQPTLHKPSMMGHRVHVLNRDDCNTLRMNVSVTGPYNADFDGDEMNIHLAQSVQARNELARITNVKYQIVGAKSSDPIIGCVQDSISGVYKLTLDDTKISYKDASNLLCNTTLKGKINKMNKEITGKDLFSYIIPDGINSKKGNKLEIKNGKLIKGILNKNEVSTKKNSIIHYVWDKYGPNETKDFIDNTQRLVLNYLMLRGLSVGFADIVIPDDLINKVNEYVNTKLLSINHQITDAENSFDNINPDIIEISLQKELNAIGPNVGKMIVDSLDNSNNLFLLAIGSKAKGNQSNIQKAFGCIGQLNLENTRIKKKVEGRTIPHFHKNDDTPEARGFLNTNYLKGLNATQFFFDAMVGREGLIDTAIKTSQTGYIQRRLIKSLEDASVRYDGTVRTSNNIIIQFLYGENGINQLTQTEIQIKLIEYSNKEVNDIFGFNSSESKKISKSNFSQFNNNLIKQMIKMRDYLRDINFKFSLDHKTIPNKFMLPVNFYRISQELIKGNNKSDLSPQDVIDGLDDVINDYNYKLLILNDNKNKLFKNDELSFKKIYKIALYEYFHPKKCILHYKLNKKSFKELCDLIKISYLKSLVEPGEMVGIIAAQSCGEPLSQMTLDTKHAAGVASSANTGIPRIQEIILNSKNIKSPQMMIYFNEDIRYDKLKINNINSHFKHLTINEMINSAEIYYDTYGNDALSKILKDDQVTVPFFIKNEKASIQSLPIVFRLKIDLEKMLEKETTLLDIKTKFISYWYNNFTNLKLVKRSEKEIINKISKLGIYSNNDNIIHIRFRMTTFNYDILTNFLKLVLNVITLKGMDKILDTNLIEQRITNFDKNSGELNVKYENVVVTAGVNFEKLKEIKGIDHTRTRCNDVNTIYRLYGIEAARHIIYYEVIAAYGGPSINHNHLALLVDLMTHTGIIISIDRHGLDKLDIDPITRASFEKTMDHFIQAALFNEKDSMESVSSRIALGRVIPGGTGAFELMLDTEKLENSEYSKDEKGGRISFNELNEESILEDILKYGINETDFFIPK
jgi:DNA-directed RNA polymerase II subunit RPB1